MLPTYGEVAKRHHVGAIVVGPVNAGDPGEFIRCGGGGPEAKVQHMQSPVMQSQRTARRTFVK